jgi:hypothetical protein
MDEKIKLSVKFNRARFNLLFMIILSAINFYFLLSNEQFYLPFSSSLSSYSVVLGVRASTDLGDTTFKIIGIVFACIVLLIYLFCYLKSKSNAFFLFMSFTVFVADTVALILITIIIRSYSILTFLDIALHFMTIYFLYSGIKAERSLSKLIKENIADNTNEIIEEDQSDEIESFSDNVLLYGNYNNNIIEIKANNGTTTMYINGEAHKALKTTDLSEFQLSTMVDEVTFFFDYKRNENGLSMSLYADDILLDSYSA